MADPDSMAGCPAVPLEGPTTMQLVRARSAKDQESEVRVLASADQSIEHCRLLEIEPKTKG
jgi:hypothetical protein